MYPTWRSPNATAVFAIRGKSPLNVGDQVPLGKRCGRTNLGFSNCGGGAPARQFAVIAIGMRKKGRRQMMPAKSLALQEGPEAQIFVYPSSNSVFGEMDL